MHSPDKPAAPVARIRSVIERLMAEGSMIARADGSTRDVDTTVGAHASAGVDYFLLKQLALTAEAKLVAAPDTSITDRFGNRRGDFDPSSISTTVGVRYFFN